MSVAAATVGWVHRGAILACGLVVTCAAGCGSSIAVIPKGKPTPKPAMVSIAPGVRVPSSQVVVPVFTVSSSHPLPSGVSAQLVVKDAEIDNLIENVAIERQDPALLAYADAGDWLAAEEGEIAHDKSAQITVLSIKDAVTSVEVGFQPDPNDSNADAAVITRGTERQIERVGVGRPVTKVTAFAVIQWLQWAPKLGRFVLCDTADA
jgi:hypothetical protein